MPAPGLAVLAVIAMLAAPLVGWAARADAPPLYPDLIALPPADLYLSREVLADGAAHHLLRFSATVSNAGEGRLELRGVTEPDGGTAVWQHLYSAPAGGEPVSRLPVGADLANHPAHHHVHLADFFGFTLLRSGPLGSWHPLPGTNGKLGSCVFDNVQVDQSTTWPRQYQGCGPEQQGLSPGWADTYDASLPDQWIDLGPDQGTPPLADGTYALRVAVDPLDRLDEGGREGNNAATVTFVVRDGRIVARTEPARCALTGEAAGPVAATATLSCTHFPAGAPVWIYWDGRDPWAEPPPPPITTFIGAGATPVSVSLPVPESPAGGHTVAAVAASFDDPASAAVIYAVEPSLAATRGGFGQVVVVALRGFGPEEVVAVEWVGRLETSSPIRVSTSPAGSATLVLARWGDGPLGVRAAGETSGAVAEAGLSLGDFHGR